MISYLINIAVNIYFCRYSLMYYDPQGLRSNEGTKKLSLEKVDDIEELPLLKKEEIEKGKKLKGSGNEDELSIGVVNVCI